MTPLIVAADRLLAPQPVDPPLLAVEHGRVLASGAAAAALAGGGAAPLRLRGTLTPALVDLQVNGGAGVSLQRPGADLWTLHAWLRDGGVLAYQPTVISAPLPRMAELCAALSGAGERNGVLALRPHLEGPFLSPQRLGVHDAAAVAACDPVALRTLAQQHAGMVTLAPEREGGFELLQDLAATGVRVSLGHSDASQEQALAAFAAGAVMVTHLFNAMAPLHHRAPALPGAALSGGAHAPWVGLVADGVHVAPSMCVMAAQLLGPRLVLVSDAVELAGLGMGEARAADGRLAGATARLDQCVRNLIGWGIPAQAAVQAATQAPADAAGLAERGALHPGRAALGVLWDADWRVVAAGPVESLVTEEVAR